MIKDFPIIPVTKRSRFSYKCTSCGECCRGIEGQVMLDSLDAYRLAKYMRDQKPGYWMVEDTLLKYGEPTPLTDDGFPIYVLKTMEDDGSCIFLQDNRCTVYEARPRTCRAYPITIAPGENGLPFSYYLCGDHPHHLTGDSVLVKDWLRKNFTKEEQEFLAAEYALIPEIGRLCKKIKERNLPKLMVYVLFCRYYDFDLEKPFMPQYLRNMQKLKEQLTKLAAEESDGETDV